MAVAELYFPAQYVNKLKDYMKNSNSMLYNNTNPTLFALADLIDPSIPLTGMVDDNGDVNNGGSGSGSSGEGNHASQSPHSFQNGNEDNGNLETANSTSHITGVITKRLAIFLNCFAFGVLLWILSFLFIFRKIRKVQPPEEGESYAELDTSGDVLKLPSGSGEDNASGSSSGPQFFQEKATNNDSQNQETVDRNATPKLENSNAVSYTHLTLPTTERV